MKLYQSDPEDKSTPTQQGSTQNSQVKTGRLETQSTKGRRVHIQCHTQFQAKNRLPRDHATVYHRVGATEGYESQGQAARHLPGLSVNGNTFALDLFTPTSESNKERTCEGGGRLAVIWYGPFYIDFIKQSGTSTQKASSKRENGNNFQLRVSCVMLEIFKHELTCSNLHS